MAVRDSGPVAGADGAARYGVVMIVDGIAVLAKANDKPSGEDRG